jgi:hypothetical protein
MSTSRRIQPRGSEVLTRIRRIPFYYAPEATRAIRPLLGDAYREDRQSFLLGLWKVFKSCQWVAPDDSAAIEDRALWFQPGRIPPLRFASAIENLIARKGETA